MQKEIKRKYLKSALKNEIIDLLNVGDFMDGVQDFKEDMGKIDHTSEDSYIEKTLKRSYEKLQRDYGKFDIDKNLIGRELVLNRARYAYQDLLNTLMKIELI